MVKIEHTSEQYHTHTHTQNKKKQIVWDFF